MLIKKIRKTVKSNWLIGLFLLLVALTLVYVFSYGQNIDGIRGEKEKAHVVKVVDGDTFNLLSGEKVRLLSINAPESGEPYSREAKEKLADLVEGKDVEIEIDQEKFDHYGRLLAYVYVNDKFVNRLMIAEGLAWSYIVPPNNKYEYELEAAEKEAKQERVGVWRSLK